MDQKWALNVIFIFNFLLLSFFLISFFFLRWRGEDSVDWESYNDTAEVWKSLPETIKYREHSLLPGLYLGYFSIVNRPSGLYVVTSKSEKNMIPLVKIRDEQHLTEQEKAWLKRETINSRKAVRLLRSFHSNDITPKALSHLFSNLKNPQENHIALSPILSNSGEAGMSDFDDPLLSLFQESLKIARSQLKLLTGVEIDSRKQIFEEPITIGEKGDIKIICFLEPFEALDKNLPLKVSRGRSRSGGDAVLAQNVYLDGNLNDMKCCYFPFALFEAIHHHVYTPEFYKNFRRRVELLEGLISKRKIEVLRQEKRKSRDYDDGWGPREIFDEELRSYESEVFFFFFFFFF